MKRAAQSPLEYLVAAFTRVTITVGPQSIRNFHNYTLDKRENARRQGGHARSLLRYVKYRLLISDVAGIAGAAGEPPLRTGRGRSRKVHGYGVDVELSAEDSWGLSFRMWSTRM